MNPSGNAESVAGETKLSAALKPFGWTCSRDFWERYYSDPWVFNLANAVERLTDEVARLTELIDGGGPDAT